MASTVSATASLGGMVQPDLNTGHRLMGVRRRVALSGILVASTAKGSGKINALITPEDGTAEDGGGGF